LAVKKQAGHGLVLPTLGDNENIGAIAKEPGERFTQKAILDQQEYADRGIRSVDVCCGHLFGCEEC